jgi:general secretion pathway protein I
VTRRAAAGFTLIEVLVALAIVALGMAALMAALGSSADSTTYQRDKTLAEWVALNRLEEVRLAFQRPTKGKTDGEAEMAGQKWRWAQEVVETEVKGILRIDVSVKPTNAPGPKDSGWYTTVSGIVGDALAPPRGDMDPFGIPPQPTGPGGGNPPGTPPNTTPPGTTTPPSTPDPQPPPEKDPAPLTD